MKYEQKSTIDSLANAISIAAYRSTMRGKAAEKGRHLLNMRRLARKNDLPELAFRMTQDLESLFFVAPAALNTRERIVRDARLMHSWAIRTNRETPWNAMWCGAQDELGERLDHAHVSAHDLIVLARYRRSRGQA